VICGFNPILRKCQNSIWIVFLIKAGKNDCSAKLFSFFRTEKIIKERPEWMNKNNILYDKIKRLLFKNKINPLMQYFHLHIKKSYNSFFPYSVDRCHISHTCKMVIKNLTTIKKQTIAEKMERQKWKTIFFQAVLINGCGSCVTNNFFPNSYPHIGLPSDTLFHHFESFLL